MGESVGRVWQPSHDWWDAFLQRYAAVLPEGLALFGSSSQSASTSASVDEGGASDEEEEAASDGEGVSEGEAESDAEDESSDGGEEERGNGVQQEPWELREARATAARLCRAL